MNPDGEEQQLVAYRALRDEALALVKDDIDALKLDLELRGLGARLADRVGEGAHDVWQQALEVAANHRSIVAGTVLALVAWLLRGPIAQGVSALFGSEDEEPEAADSAAGDSRRQGQEQGERT